jgi:hypothetical protein
MPRGQIGIEAAKKTPAREMRGSSERKSTTADAKSNARETITAVN